MKTDTSIIGAIELLNCTKYTSLLSTGFTLEAKLQISERYIKYLSSSAMQRFLKLYFNKLTSKIFFWTLSNVPYSIMGYCWSRCYGTRAVRARIKPWQRAWQISLFFFGGGQPGRSLMQNSSHGTCPAQAAWCCWRKIFQNILNLTSKLIEQRIPILDGDAVIVHTDRMALWQHCTKSCNICTCNIRIIYIIYTLYIY